MNIALKIAIVKSGRHQVQVAREAGIHVSQLSRLVNGRDTPSPRQKRELARVLGQPPGMLFPRGQP